MIPTTGVGGLVGALPVLPDIITHAAYDNAKPQINFKVPWVLTSSHLSSCLVDIVF